MWPGDVIYPSQVNGKEIIKSNIIIIITIIANTYIVLKCYMPGIAQNALRN